MNSIWVLSLINVGIGAAWMWSYQYAKHREELMEKEVEIARLRAQVAMWVGRGPPG